MTKPLILLVEDNPLLKHVAERGLRAFDVEVHTVGSGTEAVEAALSCEYDLIFMDIMMPDMDGFEATRRLREAGSEVIIIGVTAIGDQRECLAAGMNDYSTKPADYEEIMSRWLPHCERRVEPCKAAERDQVRKSGEIHLHDGRLITKDSPTQTLIDVARSFDEGKLDLTVQQVELLCRWLYWRPPERDALIEQWLEE